MAYTPQEDWASLWQTSMINMAGNYLGGKLAGGFQQGAGIDNEYTKSLIGNFTGFLGRKMLGSGEDFDLNTLTHVDTMQLIANDVIGGYFANKKLEDKKDAMKEQGMSPEEIDLALKREDAQAAREAAERAENDPLGALDSALSGVFISLGRGLGQTSSQIANAIKDGAQSAWQFASNSAMSAAKWIGSAFNSGNKVFLIASEGGVAGKYQNAEYEMRVFSGEQKNNFAVRDNGNFSIYDVNAAETFGKTGGYSEAELNNNMMELSQKLGASPSEIQQLYKDGLLPESVLSAIVGTAAGGLNSQQLSRFELSLNVAGGYRDGSVIAGGNGFFSGGQTVAGKWSDVSDGQNSNYQNAGIGNLGNAGTNYTYTIGYDNPVAQWIDKNWAQPW